jgi:hypothetical protein
LPLHDKADRLSYVLIPRQPSRASMPCPPPQTSTPLADSSFSPHSGKNYQASKPGSASRSRQVANCRKSSSSACSNAPGISSVAASPKPTSIRKPASTRSSTPAIRRNTTASRSTPAKTVNAVYKPCKPSANFKTEAEAPPARVPKTSSVDRYLDSVVTRHQSASNSNPSPEPPIRPCCPKDLNRDHKRADRKFKSHSPAATPRPRSSRQPCPPA